jgi:hypothetical protein
LHFTNKFKTDFTIFSLHFNDFLTSSMIQYYSSLPFWIVHCDFRERVAISFSLFPGRGTRVHNICMTEIFDAEKETFLPYEKKCR